MSRPTRSRRATGDLGRVVPVVHVRRGARLGDGPMEGAPRGGQGELGGDAHPTGGLAEDRHVVGIAAERLDVLLHPPQRGGLVEEPDVAAARVRLAAEVGQVQEPERAQSVVAGDHDGVANGQVGPVVPRGEAPAVHEGAAVDPEEHGTASAIGRRRPDVEGQALGLDLRRPARRAQHGVHAAHRLGRLGELARRDAYARPRLDRCGRAEAERAHGRRRERDALVPVGAPLVVTADEAVPSLDGQQVGVEVHRGNGTGQAPSERRSAAISRRDRGTCQRSPGRFRT